MTPTVAKIVSIVLVALTAALHFLVADATISPTVKGFAGVVLTVLALFTPLLPASAPKAGPPAPPAA